MRRVRCCRAALVIACLSLGCSKRDPADASASPSAGAGHPATSPASGPADDQARSEPPNGLLPVGSRAPDFSVRAHTGQQVELRGLRGQVIVLYFYPKDGTPGCTVEAEQFTLAHEDITAAGAVVLGVSSDDNESHAEFAREHGLPFMLLPDEDHALARAFGVRTTFGMTQRVTFVIDKQGVIARVYGDVSPKKHAQEILADLQHLSAVD